MELPDPQELVLVCGQRCVTGDAIVHTSLGMLSMFEIANLGVAKPEGFSPFNIKIASNNIRGFSETDLFFVAKPEPLIRINLGGEHTLTGTNEHPVLTTDGWKCLGDIQVGDSVSIKYGGCVFAPYNEPNLYDLTDETKSLLPPNQLSNSYYGLTDRNIICLASKWGGGIGVRDLARVAGVFQGSSTGLKIWTTNQNLFLEMQYYMQSMFGRNIWISEDANDQYKV